jgi:HD-GYP domain-containing protein (c-di-GMP phosphodiesterase class II)
MDGEEPVVRARADEPVELEVIEEPGGGDEELLLASSEFAEWDARRAGDHVPSLFLDASLRVLHANPAAAALFGMPERLPGMWFTQFAGSYFDEARSAELFRAVRSAEGGLRWTGTIERPGADRLRHELKVFIRPLTRPGGPEARAYLADLVDITDEWRQWGRAPFTSLLTAARQRDNDTGFHIERVNHYARALAEELRDRAEWPDVNPQFIESISRVAALHDVGKIGTSDDILNKVGPLDQWERETMQEHTKNGGYILREYPDPMAAEIALRHHERWDGNGYPYGLEGGSIPLSARIVAIADTYDALRGRRAYKEAFSHERSVAIIAAERGLQFDPRLVDRFLGIAPAFARIFSELLDPV